MMLLFVFPVVYLLAERSQFR